MSPTANFKTLAIITDELLQEFVRKARKGIEAAMREAGWRGEWIIILFIRKIGLKKLGKRQTSNC